MSAFVWCALAACLVGSGLFSGSETGFYSLSRLRVEAAARSGQLSACFALEVEDNLDSIYSQLYRAAVMAASGPTPAPGSSARSRRRCEVGHESCAGSCTR